MRRYFLLFLFCIFLGLITTVGVAWSLAKWSNYSTGMIEDFYSASDNPGIRLLVISGFGSEYITLCESPNSQINYTYDNLSINRNWSTLRHVGPGSGYDKEEARGWPFLALYSREIDVKGGTGILESGYKFKQQEIVFFEMASSGSNSSRVGINVSRVLPYRIYWLGSILDTFIYAVFWLFVFLSIAKVKNTIRNKHGHCPTCNYDLRNDMKSGCPECGWNRTL